MSIALAVIFYDPSDKVLKVNSYLNNSITFLQVGGCRRTGQLVIADGISTKYKNKADRELETPITKNVSF